MPFPVLMKFYCAKKGLVALRAFRPIIAEILN